MRSSAATVSCDAVRDNSGADSASGCLFTSLQPLVTRSCCDCSWNSIEFGAIIVSTKFTITPIDPKLSAIVNATSEPVESTVAANKY
jgi:hypothetical protein